MTNYVIFEEYKGNSEPYNAENENALRECIAHNFRYNFNDGDIIGYKGDLFVVTDDILHRTMNKMNNQKSIDNQLLLNEDFIDELVLDNDFMTIEKLLEFVKYISNEFEELPCPIMYIIKGDLIFTNY